MADQQSSILVGVFQNMADAKQAYDELNRVGYGDDYLGLTIHSPGLFEYRTPTFRVER